MNSNQLRGRKNNFRTASKSETPVLSATQTSNLSSLLSTSPLKIPLQYAISKIVSTMNKSASQSRARVSRKSSISTRVSSMQDQNDEVILKQMHQETFEFLKTYFGGRNTSRIQTRQFVQKLIDEYIGPINDAKLLNALENQLMVVFQQQFLSLWRLEQITKSNGLSGMMADICQKVKEIINQEQFQVSQIFSEKQSSIAFSQITNLKNVLTQFFESMAKSIENQLYSKFNKQMRKLVLKYNEAEELLKKINKTINYNIDKIKYWDKGREKLGREDIEQQRAKYRIIEEENKKNQIKYNLVFTQNIKLIEQNKKLLITIHTLEQQLKTRSADNYISSKRYDVSTKSTVKTQQTQQYPAVSNFTSPAFVSVQSRIVPLSPIRRTSSSTSNRNSNQPKQILIKLKQQPVGINLTTRANTPKNRRNFKSNASNMIYFA